MKKEDLIDLGFSEKEAQVFLTLVRLGPTAASTLSRLNNIKRTSVYDVLDSLIKKNLIGQFKQGMTQFYYIDDLNKLIYQEKYKLELAKDLVEDLKKQQGLSAGIQVNYYKGKEGYKELYNDILEARPKELTGWMNLDKFYAHIETDFEEKWTKERIRRGIKVRLILGQSKLTENFQGKDKKSNRETRFLPKGRDFPTSCLMYNNFIAFFNPNDEIIGIRILNADLFEMQKTIFEMNWDQLATHPDKNTN